MTVTVAGGANNIVTFTDAGPGTLKICKIAGDTATAGQNFTFTFAGQTLTVPAATSSLSSCKISAPLAAGSVTVTEQVPSGFKLVECHLVTSSGDVPSRSRGRA